MTQRLLTIGGSDPYAGGGIQTDLKTFENHRVFGLSVLTSIVTNAQADFTIHSIASELVEAQLHSLTKVSFAAIKIGLLATLQQVAAVQAFLQTIPATPVVIDPVMAMKETTTQDNQALLTTMQRELFPFATLITPNLKEAELIVGRPLHNEAQVVTAARQIAKMAQTAVVIKGGARLSGSEAIDIFATPTTLTTYRKEKLATTIENGAGCAFSASIAAQLATQVPLEQAVVQAKQYVYESIQKGVAVTPDFGSVWHRGEPIGGEKYGA